MCAVVLLGSATLAKQLNTAFCKFFDAEWKRAESNQHRVCMHRSLHSELPVYFDPVYCFMSSLVEIIWICVVKFVYVCMRKVESYLERGVVVCAPVCARDHLAVRICFSATVQYVRCMFDSIHLLSPSRVTNVLKS